MLTIKKSALVILFVIVFLMIVQSDVYAESCSYKSTIEGNHISVQVDSSNFTNLGVLEIVSLKGPIWNKLYQPTDVGWITSWGTLSENVYYGLIGGNAGDTAYWGFNAYTLANARQIPYGIYGADFSGNLTHADNFVQMNHPQDMGTNYNVCTRTGDVIIPTPSPSPSPSPTPTPISKVFFVPGFGASWNANAFASCTFDNNPNNWSLASYAASIYNPILTALSDYGWTVNPFYYDWRQQIPTNATALGDEISSITSGDEKVNLVGHSMGGLIGRQYLEDTSGAKLNKFLTAGSPHQGAVQSYPAWSGGEIWEDNFITKVAMTLFLDHCGGIFSNPRVSLQNNFPSAGNLLPIFDYILKNAKTFKPWSTMIAKNTWHLNNNFDSHGVTSETLSGTGFSTLKSILVKSPSKSDIKSGNWLDGKPSTKIYSIAGDGTVLSLSAQLPGVVDIPINETHSGLVASIPGMTEILRFLGHAPTLPLTNTFTEPNSALVVIGYPANFVITDQDGNGHTDTKGMVSFINPKSGNFKLNLLPKSGETLLVVAQFLPNGETLYKEYNFEGFQPQIKTLKFNLEKPQEDILN